MRGISTSLPLQGATDDERVPKTTTQSRLLRHGEAEVCSAGARTPGLRPLRSSGRLQSGRSLADSKREPWARGILPVTAEETATPDLVELVRESGEAFNRGDLDAAASCYAPDAVWDGSNLGLEVFTGVAAVRSVLGDLRRGYEEYEEAVIEGRDLGNGVWFIVTRLNARLVGSPATVQELWAFTSVWRAKLIEPVVMSRDIDAARAAAERLAQERADG